MTNANFMLDPKYFWKSIDLIERVNDNLPVDTITKVLRAVDNKNDRTHLKYFILSDLVIIRDVNSRGNSRSAKSKNVQGGEVWP